LLDIFLLWQSYRGCPFSGFFCGRLRAVHLSIKSNVNIASHDSIDEEVPQGFDVEVSQEFDEEKEAKDFSFSNESKFPKIVQAFTLKVYIDKRHHVIIEIC
jgi:hypothetical protein